ncbi:predicted protein [Arabidopsis lyrata subsp. lyrata]|uniref:Predicted protein n=1 Tax=Arabidopsis lyrata subsp. lyrata TaxID=81972 RepID=D7MI32_ARALL|nr:predicted protein [Arabidopsis lyrata subsp. lyrata]
MASNLIPFKGFPTLEMIAKLKYNINTLNSEIETLIVTTHPVAISLLSETFLPPCKGGGQGQADEKEL